MIKKENIFTIYNLLIFSLIVRFIFAIFYSDKTLENEWGIIFHNYQVAGIFGYNVVINDFLALPNMAKPGDVVLPTVFMPPLYFYYIYSFKFLTNDFFYIVNLVIFSQIILNTASVYFFHKIVEMFEKDRPKALFITAIFSFFPINIYASSQISSVTLQIFLIILFLYFLLIFNLKNEIKIFALFSIISGFLILIRGEFLVFYIFALFYFLIVLKKKFSKIVLSLFITLIIISPYLYRNYQIFDQFVLTKSFGYNLLKGNNPSKIIEGNAGFIENQYDIESLKISADVKYEINLDNFYKDRALEFIKKDPFEYLKLYFLKVFTFLFFDINSTYPHYYNLFHILPKFLVSIASFFGGILSLKKRGFSQFLALYYFFNILLFSVFFILPRYSLICLPVQLLLSIEFFRFLRRKLIN